MKKIIILMTAFIFSFNAFSQNVKTDKDGNFHAILKDTTITTNAKSTGKTYTDSKKVKYPVMVSKNGKYFIVRTSQKTGKQYNFYLQVTAKND